MPPKAKKKTSQSASGKPHSRRTAAKKKAGGGIVNTAKEWAGAVKDKVSGLFSRNRTQGAPIYNS